MDCSLTFERTIVTSFGADNTLGQQLLEVVVVRPDGNFLASTVSAGELVSVDRNTSQVTRIVGPGEGPGELAGRFLMFPIPAADTVYLTDMSGRIHTLSPDNRLIAQTSVARMRPVPRGFCALGSGSFVSASGRVRAELAYWNSALRMERTFRHPQVTWPENSNGDGQIWCGRGPYVIVLADPGRTHGQLAIVMWSPISDESVEVRIRLPWARGGSLSPAEREGRTQKVPLSEVIGLHDFGDGKILLLVRTPEVPWQPDRRGKGRTELDKLFDVKAVLINVLSKRVLGETTLDSLSVIQSRMKNDGVMYDVDQDSTIAILVASRFRSHHK